VKISYHHQSNENSASAKKIIGEEEIGIEKPHPAENQSIRPNRLRLAESVAA